MKQMPSRRTSSTPSPRAMIRWALLVGTLWALWVNAPALWLTTWLSDLSEQRIQFKQVQGTVWQGSAQWALTSGARDGSPSSSQIALPSRIHWSLRMGWVSYSPAVTLQLESACCTASPLVVQTSIDRSGVQVAIEDHTSTWPTAWLTGLGAPWNTLQPQGQMQLSTHGWHWHSNQPQQFAGQIKVQIQDFSTQLSTLKPLGTYDIIITGEPTASLALTTVQGALQLKGQGQWVHQHFFFTGEASAQEDSVSALSNLLNVLGQRHGNSSTLKIS